MKKLLVFAMGLFLISLVFMGCDDSDSDNPGNYIKHDNVSYALSNGFVFDASQSEKDAKLEDGSLAVYPVGLLLVSSGFTIYPVDGNIDSISGTGSGIFFIAYSTSSDKLADGHYVLDSLALDQSGIFLYADAVFDYNVATGDGIETEISSGTLDVKSDGDDYEISFDCKGKDGKSITGYYKGSVESYLSAAVQVKSSLSRTKSTDVKQLFDKK
ncbi:hypothetical protein LA303_01965 [Candidatus Sulfidibacterium hydrothermale]|uniref:hypothetical protein n=1 Tax=Candidatus Sulfidibacterium hydrothermale TaxID=2875962 RepID=UPI001F0B55A8|nr:hypothetical protein [Candidatus Sulfidibacterium hydrothermale]UBM62759.1 hypothetical protein LA303_01965 [Candidatus Sulfidibacterium hydrothermale]